MGQDEKKMEIILEGSEVPVLLKALGEVFRNPVLPEAMKAFGPHLAACEKVALTLKQIGGMAEFKVKAKGLAPLDREKAGPARPASYKTLRKRLKTAAKFLRHCRDGMTLPPAEVLEAFLANSRAISEHPERPQLDYAPYRELCERLRRACAERNRTAAREAFAEIESFIAAHKLTSK